MVKKYIQPIFLQINIVCMWFSLEDIFGMEVYTRYKYTVLREEPFWYILIDKTVS